MTGETANPAASIPRTFVALWPLTIVVPWLLIYAAYRAIKFNAADGAAYLPTPMLTILAWLLIAFLQFGLLRAHLRRSHWWLIATVIGGYLGYRVGSLVRIQMESSFGSFIANDGDVPGWLIDYFPGISIFTEVGIRTALLGIFQSFCLEDSFRGRLQWCFASAFGGIAGGVAGNGSGLVALWWVPQDFMFEQGDGLGAAFRVSVMGVCGRMVFGGFTGFVLRRLLIRRMQRQRETLIGHFD